MILAKSSAHHHDTLRLGLTPPPRNNKLVKKSALTLHDSIKNAPNPRRFMRTICGILRLS